jgi:CRP-like cAMP-binding protein
VNNALRPDAAAVDLLLRRLDGGGGLRADGLAPFGRLEGDGRSHAAGEVILSTARGVRLVAAGFVGEARLLGDGRRQIIALRLPGDIFGPGVSAPGCSVVALTPAQTVDASAMMTALGDPSPRFDALRQAWAAARRIEDARMADHVVRLGRLSAYERAAHLLLELHERLLATGLASATVLHLPLTQEILADVLGLSIVHVNRTLQQLRRDGLIAYRGSNVSLLDPARLAEAAGALRVRAPQAPLAPRKMTPASLLHGPAISA